MSAQKYDATLRVVTAFFAALIGFGLKNLLDLKPGHELFNFQISCFLISVSVFLRFLTGSANHMWLEYVNHRDRPAFFFFLDVCALLFLGVLASFICYASSLDAYMALNIALLSSAALWSIVMWLFSLVGFKEVGSWRGWFYVNSLQALAFTLVWRDMPNDWGWNLPVLAVLSGAAFCLDFTVQLYNLNKKTAA